MQRTRLIGIVLLFALSAFALERQPNSAYRARREALSKKTSGGIVLLFAGSTQEDDDNFYYLTGLDQSGGALLIAPALSAEGETAARPYTEDPLPARSQSHAGTLDRGEDRP